MDLLSQSLLFLLCLSGSFYFSGIETGFISWNPMKVSHLASQGNTTARWALYLMNHQDKVISSILIGNNICNIGAALVFLGILEKLTFIISFNFFRIPSPESWLLTPVMVLFCEMLPKSLFRTYPFRLTMRAIPMLLMTYFVVLPLTWSFSELSKLFKKTGNQESQETFQTKVREEMVLIAGEGSRRGTLIEAADQYIHRVLTLKNLSVMDLMISMDELSHKFQIVGARTCVSEHLKSEIKNNEIIVTDHKSGIPIGIVSILDLIGVHENVPISRFIRKFDCIESSMPILTVFQYYLRSSMRLIQIKSTNGSVLGFIDKEDLIYTVFGGIQTDFSQE